MYLILMVYACLISCSLINKSKCHSLAYFNLRWTCVVILHKAFVPYKGAYVVGTIVENMHIEYIKDPHKFLCKI